MRKIITGVILISMTLHCFSRLGVLSYLFEKRQEIAYAIGLIAEIPIALCGSDYDFNDGLSIQHDNDHDLPQHFTPAHEIVLIHTYATVAVGARCEILCDSPTDRYRDKPYPPPATAIFHPPALS